MPFQMKKSFVKATSILYPWAELAMGRVCNGPRLLWAKQCVAIKRPPIIAFQYFQPDNDEVVDKIRWETF